MRLIDLIERAGKSQAALAEHLGVTRQTVHDWGTGRRRVPAGRAQAIAEFLEVDERAVAGLAAFDPKAEPVTFFGWLFSNGGPLFALAPDPEARLRSVADATGTPWADLEDWVMGRERIPVEWALDFMGRFLPGVNPVVLEHEVFTDGLGRAETEREALVNWVGSVLDHADTFEEAALSLQEAKAKWQFNLDVVDLDDGRPVPEVLQAKVREFAAEAGRAVLG